MATGGFVDPKFAQQQAAQDNYDKSYVDSGGNYRMSGFTPSAAAQAKLAQLKGSGFFGPQGPQNNPVNDIRDKMDAERAAQKAASDEQLRKAQDASMERYYKNLQMEDLKKFLGGMNGGPGGSGGAGGGGGTGGSGGGGSVPGAPVNEQAIRDATLARTKEKIGQAARGAITSTKEMAAGSGLGGSPVAAKMEGDVIKAGQSDMVDAITGQEMAGLTRQQEVADRDYAGNIVMRGQDKNLFPSLLGILSSRGIY